MTVVRGGPPVRRRRSAPARPLFAADAPVPRTGRSAARGRALAGGRPPLCYRRRVADEPAQATVYDVVCPHCGKSFREELLTGRAERYHGFKCPHCRLFVPFERVEEQDRAEPVD